MRSVRTSTLALASAFLLLLPASIVGGDEGKSAAKPAKWKITADLEESCSCDGPCPCWWGNKPTKTNCSGGMVVFIKKGTYGNVPLDGLALAEMVQSPDGKAMMESMGNFNVDNVYLDSKATPEQKAALQAIAAQVLPPPTPGKTNFKDAPITRTMEGKEHVVTVGPYATFSGHVLDGFDGGTPKIVNPPFSDPMHKEWQQGVTTKQTMNDGATWEFANTNYMYNTFSATSEDYEKFAAKMAKMMEKK
jgi:hypothetical protein